METPWYETFWFFLFWVAVTIAGRYIDILSSRHFEWYGMSEGNKYWRKPDGTFDEKANVLWFTIYAVAGGIIGGTGFFGATHPSWGAACALIIPAGPLSALIAIPNFKQKKYNRQNQIEILNQLRADPTASAQWEIKSKDGKAWAKQFQFLSVEMNLADLDDTFTRVDKKIRDYAVNVPPEQWFKF